MLEVIPYSVSLERSVEKNVGIECRTTTITTTKQAFDEGLGFGCAGFGCPEQLNFVQTGNWLPNARRVPCPNWDERPPGVVVDLLVIHGISLPPGRFGGPWIDDLFRGHLDPQAHPYFREIAHVPVSAHLLVRRDGELVQYVDLDKRAWHAGHSIFEGRPKCNDFSIGIELEGTDLVPYEDAQYSTLADATQEIRARFSGIQPRRIVGHSDIAPGRKTDPGPAFDWERFRELIGD